MQGMNTDDDEIFAQWLDATLKDEGRGAAQRLADHLEVDKSQVSHWRKGNLKRGFTLPIRQKIVEYYADRYSGPELSSPKKAGGVAVIGRVGAWYNQEDFDQDEDRELVGSPITEPPLDEQKAFRVMRKSRDGSYQEGDYVYTIDFEATRKSVAVGNKIVVCRKSGDLISYCLKKAVRRGGDVILEPVIEASPLDATINEEHIVGLVVGTFRPERGIL